MTDSDDPLQFQRAATLLEPYIKSELSTLFLVVGVAGFFGGYGMIVSSHDRGHRTTLGMALYYVERLLSVLFGLFMLSIMAPYLLIVGTIVGFLEVLPRAVAGAYRSLAFEDGDGR